MAKHLGEIFSPIRLLVRQSKSLRLFLFEPDLMRASNCNLVEFGSRTRTSGGAMSYGDYRYERDFVLPPGGVRKGLCGRFLKISRLKKRQTEVEEAEEEEEYDEEEYEYEQEEEEASVDQ